MNILSKNKYIIMAISLFFLDFFLTWYYLNFSSYASEGNPLFLIDGGYLSIIVNTLYLILIIILEKVLINKYKTIYLESNNSFEYSVKLFKSESSKFILVSSAFAFIWATLLSRLVAIIDWIIYGV